MTDREAMFSTPEERTRGIHRIAQTMKEMQWRWDAGIPRRKEDSDLYEKLKQDLLFLLQERRDDPGDDSKNYQSVAGIDY